MKKIKYISTLTFFVLILTQCHVETEQKDKLSTRTVGPQPDGSILVPTNQLLRPAGFRIIFPGRPVDLALSPDGKWLAVLNKSSLDLIRVLDRTIMQTLPIRGGASFNGVSFSADGKQIYASQARNKIFIAQKDENNISVEKGYKSTIMALSFGDNPDAAIGKDGTLVEFEEAGKRISREILLKLLNLDIKFIKEFNHLIHYSRRTVMASKISLLRLWKKLLDTARINNIKLYLRQCDDKPTEKMVVSSLNG